MSDAVNARIAIPTGTWAIDPKHSAVTFVIKHMGFARIRGQFRTFEGRIEVDAERGTITAAGEVDAASIDTNQPKRDAHLRSPDFFDVERFPRIAFATTSVDPIDEQRLRLAGPMTMHGVTQDVVFDAEVGGPIEGHDGNQRLGVSITAELDRSAFGVDYNRVVAGVTMLPQRVEIALDLQAIPAG